MEPSGAGTGVDPAGGQGAALDHAGHQQEGRGELLHEEPVICDSDSDKLSSSYAC